MSRHEGISRRGNGWYVDVRVGSGRRYRATFGTLGEAVSARDKARDDARAGRAVLDARTSKVTVGDTAAAYLAVMAARWAPRSRRLHASEWRALEPVFGTRLVCELRPSDVSDWLIDLSARRSAKTVGAQLGLLRAILDRAAIDLHIPNVARLVRRQRPPRGQGASMRFAFSASQIAAVLEAVEDRYRIVVLLCLTLGLRSGEARGLTIDRVDMATGKILIDRQLLVINRDELWPEVDRIHATAAFGPPKTDNSVGVVRAPVEVLEAIADHVDCYGLGPHGLIVTGHRGQPLAARQWTKEMARIRAVTGVELTGHDLRHTRGSRALANGATPAEVAVDLRHDVATTIRTYLHADEPADAARAAGVLDWVNAAGARKVPARGHLRAV